MVKNLQGARHPASFKIDKGKTCEAVRTGGKHTNAMKTNSLSFEIIDLSDLTASIQQGNSNICGCVSFFGICGGRPDLQEDPILEP